MQAGGCRRNILAHGVSLMGVSLGCRRNPDKKKLTPRSIAGCDSAGPGHHAMLPPVFHNSGSRSACRRLPRSEEHTSDLQSLMRISYAVFCLKNKKKAPIVKAQIHTTEPTA